VTARTHDLAAITALGLVILVEPLRTITLGTALIAILANQLGGIAPDIDQPTAPFWRNLPITRFIGKYADNLLGGHRFLTHSILGLALFGFLARGLLAFLHPIMPNIDSGYVWWAFMIGMASHLVMDSFTKEGVPWLLPIPIKFGFPPLKKLRITTGKAMEAFIIFPAFIVFDIWVCATNYDKILALIQQHLK
jgi:inner membrane protein